jgi:20S proteasome subunit beta 4
MDHLLGLVGDGYALVAADRKVNHSIIAVKHDEDKILPLDESKLLGCVGELGDTKNFTEFIQKNVALYGLRNGSKLSTHATAHYVRGEIAHAIRSSPKMCNMILVGYDEDGGASLYHIDYLGGMHKMNYGAHGYGGFFCSSLFDRCRILRGRGGRSLAAWRSCVAARCASPPVVAVANS